MKPQTHFSTSAWLLTGLLAVLCLPARAVEPIIDMHLHAFGFDEYGDPPPPNEITGRIPPARDDRQAMAATLREMDRHGIVLGVASGPLEHVAKWRAAAPERILGGAYTGARDDLPDVAELRQLFSSGQLQVLGELGLQYRGEAPADEALRAYFALAEELDVPVGLHTGLGDSGTPYGCCPKFRTTLGRPSLVEEVLVRHPRLRIYLMHAGYPYLEETKALLYIYPQLHVDISVINWALPRAEFHAYLRALVDAGFARRILFGSDQMIWPEAIGLAIAGVESAQFLNTEQRRAIFYDNAARFLRLSDEQIARHHRHASAVGTPAREELATSKAPKRRLLIRDVAIVDPATNAVSPPRDILIEAGTITRIEAGGSIVSDGSTPVVEAQGLFALPGLIDVHAHLGDGGLGEQGDEDRVGALAQFLRYGVTTIFVPGGGGGNDHHLASWKQRCASEQIACPNLYGSGALITAPGSHPITTIWQMASDADPAVVYERGAVTLGEDEDLAPLLGRKLAQGVDALKVVVEDWGGEVPRLSRRRLAELTHAAHDRNLRVFAHVSLHQHVADSVAAGIDGVMHSSEQPLPAKLLAEMARQRVFYVATLALYDGFFDRAHGRLEPEPYAAAGAAPRALESLAGWGHSPFPPSEARVLEGIVRDNLRLAAAAGVPLALGSDTNNPSVFPGYSAHEELELMVQAGLTPAQALDAATRGGAEFLGQADRLGQILPGYQADLLLLKENPLQNILDTRQLFAVFAKGRQVEGIVTAP